MSQKLKENKKNWSAVKTSIRSIKSLFNQPYSLDESLNFGFINHASWSPPTVRKLEESVFTSDLSSYSDTSTNNSIDSLQDSFSYVPSISSPLYLHCTTSQIAPVPLRSALKGALKNGNGNKIYRCPSEPTFATANQSSPSVLHTINTNKKDPQPFLDVFSFENESHHTSSFDTTPHPTKARSNSRSKSLRRKPNVPLVSMQDFTFQPSPPSHPTRSLRFSETVMVYETYSNLDYSREAVEAPEFTLKQVEKLNKEIRKFKLTEMLVHPDSKVHTSLSI